jgi:DNA-binding transcriptional MerR regulator
VNEALYKLDELARAAGTSARTVRYYVQRGLLPPPAFRGKDTAYGREHLVRLRAIRRLQEAFFPLDAIAVELERRSLPEIERIAEGLEVPTAQLGAPPPAANLTPPMRSSPPSPSALSRTFRRVELAPGVELSIAEDAPLESRMLAEKILEDSKKGA